MRCSPFSPFALCAFGVLCVLCAFGVGRDGRLCILRTADAAHGFFRTENRRVCATKVKYKRKKPMMKSFLAGAVAAAGIFTAVSAAQAAGDADKGKDVFKECMACHTVEAGKNRVGPSLFGVVGRKAGAVEGFAYSKPMLEKAAAGLVWSEEELAKYLKNPKKEVPGGKMSYPGLEASAKFKAAPDAAAADLIAYLATAK